MHIILLTIGFMLMFCTLTVCFLRLIEDIFEVRNSLLRLLVFSFLTGLVGTVSLCLFGSMSSLGYGIMLVVFTGTIMFFFKGQSTITRIACILTFNTNIMVSRAICSSFISIITGKSILELSTDKLWFWTILILTSLVSTIFTLFIIKLIPQRYLRVIRQRTEQIYAYIAIATLSNIYLIANGMVYITKIDLAFLNTHQLIASITWLLVMYVGMFMMAGFDALRADQENFEKDIFYKDLILSKALLVAEIDCTNDKLLRLIVEGKQQEISPRLTYTEYIQQQAIQTVHQEDFYDLIKGSSIDYIKNHFKDGNEEFSYTYRTRTPQGDYHWIRSSVMLHPKSTPDNIVAICTVYDDVHETINEQSKLKNIAQIDPLVNIYNKATSQSLIKEHLEHSENGTLFLFDLDNFKGINDNMGHAYGDSVLKEIAGKIENNFRKGDVVGRIGGDEFIGFIKATLHKEDIERKAKKICDSVIKTYVGDNGVKVTVSCSIGVAIAPDNGKDFKELFKNSDLAMYKSKANGKNTFALYNEEECSRFAPKQLDDYKRD